MRTGSTALSCDLASHGFIMACVEHRDRSACTTVRKIPKPGAPGEYEDEWIPLTMVGAGKKKRAEEFPLRMRQVKSSKFTTYTSIFGSACVEVQLPGSECT